MKTLQQQLTEHHQRITKLGGKVPTPQGSLERQLCECAAEIVRLTKNGKAESRRTKAVECYEAMGLSPAAAKIAASLERGVQTNDVNRIFEAGLLGMSEAAAKIFADPTVNPNPIPKSPIEQLLEVKK